MQQTFPLSSTYLMAGGKSQMEVEGGGAEREAP